MQTGDILVSWGAGWKSKLIRFLISAITQDKYPPTHISIAISNNEILSAEASGIKIIKLDKLKKDSEKIKIYRYNNITNIHKKALKQIIKKYVNKKYDYSLYLNWFLKILTTLLPFFKIFTVWFDSKIKKNMASTYECSELTTLVWQDLGFSFGYKKPQYTTPVDVYFSISGCDNYDLIKEINVKQKESKFNLFKIVLFILSFISLLIILRLFGLL
jgi:hypothetical protein